MIDTQLRAKACMWYALARHFYRRGDYWSCSQAQRIACITWHLADPELDWDEVVHC